MPTLHNSIPSLHDRARELLLESSHFSTPYAILSRPSTKLVDYLLEQQPQQKLGNNQQQQDQQRQQQQEVSLLQKVEELRYQISKSIFKKSFVGRKRLKLNTTTTTTDSNDIIARRSSEISSSSNLHHRQHQNDITSTSSSSFLPSGMTINALEWQYDDSTTYNNNNNNEDNDDEDTDGELLLLQSDTTIMTTFTGCHALDELLMVPRHSNSSSSGSSLNDGFSTVIEGNRDNNSDDKNLLFGHVWKISSGPSQSNNGDNTNTTSIIGFGCGCGKTQLALQLSAASIAISSSSTTTTKVDYICSKSSHCPISLQTRHKELIKSIKRNIMASSSSDDDGVSVNNLPAYDNDAANNDSHHNMNIDFHGVTNTTQLLYRIGIFEQELLLSSSLDSEEKEEHEQQQQHHPRHQKRLLIIDSISNIIIDDHYHHPTSSSSSNSSSSSYDQYNIVLRKCRFLTRLYPTKVGIIIVSSNSNNNNMVDIHLQICNNNSNNSNYNNYQPTSSSSKQIGIKLLKHPYKLISPTSTTTTTTTTTSTTSSSSSLLSLKLTPFGITT